MDFSEIKSVTIPEGEVTKITSGSAVLWEAITFTNLVPTSIDTDGSIYNKVGYKDNVRLSSSGSISGSAQSGSVTTGFMPFKYTDTIYMKGAQWLNASTNYGGHFYFSVYNANRVFIENGYIASSSMSNANVYSQLTVTYDATTGITSFKIPNPDGTTGNFRKAAQKASYLRINAYGKGANLIITRNEEIIE